MASFARSSKKIMRDRSRMRNIALIEEIILRSNAVENSFYDLDFSDAQQFHQLYKKLTDYNLCLCNALNSFEIGDDDRIKAINSAEKTRDFVNTTKNLDEHFYISLSEGLSDLARTLWGAVEPIESCLLKYLFRKVTNSFFKWSLLAKGCEEASSVSRTPLAVQASSRCDTENFDNET